MVQLVFRDADARVPDRQLNRGNVSDSVGSCRQGDLALFGEFGGIGDQIKQDLPDFRHVAVQGVEVLFEIENEFVGILFDETKRRVSHIFGNLLDGKVLEV